MAQVKLFLFGPPRLEQNGEELKLRGRKIMALAAYLALSRQPYSRDALATLLWPDHDQAGARANLRRELSRLNKELGEGQLAIEPETIGLHPEADLWLDLARFQACLAAAQSHLHPANEVCPDCLPLLLEAARLYTADFLAGFTLSDSPEFDEWQFFQAEGLRQALATALTRLVQGYSAQGNFEAAIPYARRRLTLDPLHEPAHQQLMRLYAQSGQQATALRQYQECVRLLKTELGVAPSDETVALYEAIKAKRFPPTAKSGLASARPRLEVDGQESNNIGESSSLPLARPPAPRHNLPPQSTPFIGREAELAEIGRRLREEADCRLLSLVGPGGIGKTRLSIEAASAQLTRFADGVTFVSLAPVNPADFEGSIDPLVATMADTLKLAFHAATAPTRQLLDYLGQKTMLIVLDNFEPLLDSAEVVSAIITGAPQVKLLVTSRERLNLPEEWLYPLEGLAVPIDTSLPLGVPVGGYSALQLFEQRARQVKPGFELAAEQAGVIRICRLMGGSPLGIELAAAWVRMLSCQAIAAEIEKNIDFLSTTMRTIPDRHRSLRAVFDHSWRLLSAMEQAVLGRLSVFQGGFQPEAAQAVAGAALTLLAVLVDKSMLQVSPNGRYELHELLKQFVTEKFRQNSEAYEAIRDQHCHYFATFLQQQEPQLKGTGLKASLAAILADLDNVRLAWRWAVERNQQAEIEQSLESLFLFYEIQGWFLEGQEAFKQATAMLEAQCALRERSGEADVVPESCLLYGRVLFRQSWLQVRLGLYERTEAQFQKSLGLLRRAGDRLRRELACCLIFWGASLDAKKEPAKAVSPGKESLALYEALGDAWGSGVVLVVLGQAVLRLGQFEEAERLTQEGTTRLSQIGEHRFIIYAMQTLGRLAVLQGNYPQAERWYQECLKQWTELDDRTGTAYILGNLGETARLQDRPDQARQYYQQSLSLAKEIGLRSAHSITLWGLGSLAERLGHYPEAKHHFQESLALAAFEGKYVTEDNPAGPGWAYLGLGEVQAAMTYFRDALHFALQKQAVPLGLDALTGTAYLLAQAGKPAQALELLALVQHHSASTQETKDRAAKLQDELIAELPPEAVAAAKERGKERTLEAVAVEILAGEPQYYLA